MAKEAELRIVATMCRKKPNYTPLAQTLLPIIRAYFQDPKNEAEFQAYIKEKEKGREVCGRGAALDG